jgi:hypothetical protein
MKVKLTPSSALRAVLAAIEEYLAVCEDVKLAKMVRAIRNYLRKSLTAGRE